MSTIIKNTITNKDLSTFLLENINRFDLSETEYYSDKIDTIRAYHDYIRFIDSAGWVEHASDWDLFTKIELIGNDDEEGEIFTAPGYPELSLIYISETICVLDYKIIPEEEEDIDDENEGTTTGRVPLYMIKSLTLTR